MPVSAEEIIDRYTNGKMSSRPGFYAGRGNTTTDLNSQLLEKIYEGIRTEIGQDAAKAFVNMVEHMVDDASATTFLITLKRLEQYEWKYDVSLSPRSAFDASGQTVADEFRKGNRHAAEAAFVSVFGGMLGGKMEHKNGGGLPIISDFLYNHRSEMEGVLPQDIFGSSGFFFERY